MNSDRELYCIGKAYKFFDYLTQYSMHTQEAQVDSKLAYVRKIIDLSISNTRSRFMQMTLHISVGRTAAI